MLLKLRKTMTQVNFILMHNPLALHQSASGGLLLETSLVSEGLY